MADDLSNFPIMDSPQIDVPNTFEDWSSDTVNLSTWDQFTSGMGSVWDAITSPTAKNLLTIGSGLYGLYESGQQRNLAKDAMAKSDPFGPYRAQYAQQLSALMMNPGSITEDPGYKFQFEQGQQAVERGMAAKGYLGSGNEGIALTQYGQNFAANYLNAKISQLSGLAGANITPNYGPGLQAYGQGLDTASAALASLGYGITRGGASAGTPGASSGPSAAGGEAAKIGGAISTVGRVAGSEGLSTVGSAVGNFGNIISGIERGGTAGAGSAVSAGARLAGVAGYGGTTASTIGAVGDVASGNYLGAAKNLYSAFAPVSAASLGLSGVASGAAANAALTEAGFGTAWSTPAIGAATSGAGAAAAGSTAGTASTAGAAAGSSSLASTAVPILGAVVGGYGTVKSIQAGDTKSAVVSGASTGAAIGSIVPGIGTLVGGIIGGVVGGLGAAIHGKDYSEEKVRDKYYSAVEQMQKAGAGYDTRSIVDPRTFYQAFAGEFRGSHSAYPARSSGKYGQKDEDVFISDMKSKIEEAYSSGVVQRNANAQEILDKVVTPWFNQEMGGWRTDIPQQWVADQKSLTLDLINRYISGQPVDWNAIGG